jgi:hypothetical protein
MNDANESPSALFRKIMYVIQKADSPKDDGHSEIRALRALSSSAGGRRAMRGLSALFRKLRFSAPVSASPRLRDENTPASTIAPVARQNFCLLIGGAGFSLPIRT